MESEVFPSRFLKDRVQLQILQREIAKQVVVRNCVGKLDVVAGCDVAYKETRGCAAVVLLSYPVLDTVEVVRAEADVGFPYIPGFLAFRELPLILCALQKLKTTPHCIIVDGHGIAHPRHAGLACHLGLLSAIPTIGCAKTLLVGDYVEPQKQKGAHSPLRWEGRTVGSVLRSRAGAKPVFVSPGHLVDVDTAREIVLRCCARYRTPEPLRLAHIQSRKEFTTHRSRGSRPRT
ncbi:hypothetical protein AMJ40_03965 [candidate division TA06 bacterium DG_26]|uniref:Endonuclease V n=1 Tax=candidate division TA06 bacterium DG_26 TaxID=1703771 RepID=A0A0S7WIV5_UNCT6|nr:MAG: hypothetical protein AMJ40_03965 [candidate division TA06 bacterium DG_26]